MCKTLRDFGLVDCFVRSCILSNVIVRFTLINPLTFTFSQTKEKYTTFLPNASRERFAQQNCGN